jgi:hypothetical protein
VQIGSGSWQASSENELYFFSNFGGRQRRATYRDEFRSLANKRFVIAKDYVAGAQCGIIAGGRQRKRLRMLREIAGAFFRCLLKEAERRGKGRVFFTSKISSGFDG